MNRNKDKKLINDHHIFSNHSTYIDCQTYKNYRKNTHTVI